MLKGKRHGIKKPQNDTMCSPQTNSISNGENKRYLISAEKLTFILTIFSFPAENFSAKPNWHCA